MGRANKATARQVRARKAATDKATAVRKAMDRKVTTARKVVMDRAVTARKVVKVRKATGSKAIPAGKATALKAKWVRKAANMALVAGAARRAAAPEWVVITRAVAWAGAVASIKARRVTTLTQITINGGVSR